MMPNWEHLSYNGKTFLQDLIYIFPELKESEDEKTRKEIISFLKEGKPYHCPNSAKRQEWAAWLEKQKEHKPVGWSDEDNRKIEFLINLVNEWCDKAPNATF